EPGKQIEDDATRSTRNPRDLERLPPRPGGGVRALVPVRAFARAVGCARLPARSPLRSRGGFAALLLLLPDAVPAGVDLSGLSRTAQRAHADDAARDERDVHRHDARPVPSRAPSR